MEGLGEVDEEYIKDSFNLYGLKSRIQYYDHAIEMILMPDPPDEEDLQDGDILVPVAHYSKEVFSTFGSPFLILLSQGDTVGMVKKKIQNKLGVSQCSISYCINSLRYQ